MTFDGLLRRLAQFVECTLLRDATKEELAADTSRLRLPRPKRDTLQYQSKVSTELLGKLAWRSATLTQMNEAQKNEPTR